MRRSFVVSFDRTETHSYAASAAFVFQVFGPPIPLRPGDKVRGQHIEAYFSEPSRKVQIFGALGVGLAFFDSSGALIDSVALATLNPNTPDATVVPVDNMDVAAEDTHFLEVASLQFAGSVIPVSVAAFGIAAAKNSDGAAAHILTLGVLGVIEIETE